MKTRTILLAFAIVLAACDRGTAPGCASSDSTCATTGIGGSTSASGNGNGNTSGNGNTNGSDDDTASSGTGAFTSWFPAYDTGANIKTLTAGALTGKPGILGGDVRRLAFSIQDSTLHIVASSDGQTLDNFGRETVYDIKILSEDTLMFGFDSRPDAGLTATSTKAWEVVDSRVLHSLNVKLPTIAVPLYVHVTTRSKSTLMVWVKVRSGDPVANVEDSLPRLDIAATRKLLFSGAGLSPIPSDPFLVEIP